MSTIEKLYEMVRAGQHWELDEPERNTRGDPVIHDIARQLGCMRTCQDSAYTAPEISEDTDILQPKKRPATLAANVSWTPRQLPEDSPFPEEKQMARAYEEIHGEFQQSGRSTDLGLQIMERAKQATESEMDQGKSPLGSKFSSLSSTYQGDTEQAKKGHQHERIEITQPYSNKFSSWAQGCNNFLGTVHGYEHEAYDGQCLFSDATRFTSYDRFDEYE